MTKGAVVEFWNTGIITDLAARQSTVGWEQGKWGSSTEHVMDRPCSKIVQKQVVLTYVCL